MVMHARSGGELEIMGLMQGYTDGDTIVVTDAFGLPVEGTETRVNAQDDANEYIVEYLRLSRDQGSRQENVVGWYHSHPGYGCWLSGIDVETQKTQQTFMDPFVAVVIDPDRTISAGRVDIGAFRTFPADYKPPAVAASSTSGADNTSSAGTQPSAAASRQAVPTSKADDFGAHADKYYPLAVSHYKSTLDVSLLELLWNKYWVQTLSQSPLITNRDYANKQMLDLASKLRDATSTLSRAYRGAAVLQSNANLDSQIEMIARSSNTVAMKEKQGLMAGKVKATIFSNPGTHPHSKPKETV